MVEIRESGEAFGVSEVVGLEPGRGEEWAPALRAALANRDHSEPNAPAGQHHWRDHDVLVWDNASVQHKAGGDFRLGEPRRF